MQEFTTSVKKLTTGLRTDGVRRNVGALQDSLNMQPCADGKLRSVVGIAPLFHYVEPIIPTGICAQCLEHFYVDSYDYSLVAQAVVEFQDGYLVGGRDTENDARFVLAYVVNGVIQWIKYYTRTTYQYYHLRFLKVLSDDLVLFGGESFGNRGYVGALDGSGNVLFAFDTSRYEYHFDVLEFATEYMFIDSGASCYRFTKASPAFVDHAYIDPSPYHLMRTFASLQTAEHNYVCGALQLYSYSRLETMIIVDVSSAFAVLSGKLLTLDGYEIDSGHIGDVRIYKMIPWGTKFVLVFDATLFKTTNWQKYFGVIVLNADLSFDFARMWEGAQWESGSYTSYEFFVGATLNGSTLVIGTQYYETESYPHPLIVVYDLNARELLHSKRLRASEDYLGRFTNVSSYGEGFIASFEMDWGYMGVAFSDCMNMEFPTEPVTEYLLYYEDQTLIETSPTITVADIPGSFYLDDYVPTVAAITSTVTAVADATVLERSCTDNPNYPEPSA